MGLPVLGGMTEESVQSVSGDLAIYVQLPIELIKSGQKGRNVLHFFPHFGQLEKCKESKTLYLCKISSLFFLSFKERHKCVEKYSVHEVLKARVLGHAEV